MLEIVVLAPGIGIGGRIEISHFILPVKSFGVFGRERFRMSFITYSLRCLADGIDYLPAHTLRSLLFITIPLILAWFYRKYVHIPAGERSVEFEWIVPPEAS